MAWPENWIDLNRINPLQRETKMVEIARDVGGPDVAHRVFLAVNNVLTLDPFHVSGLSISALPAIYHEAFAAGADSGAVLRHRHHHDAYSAEDTYREEAVFWTRRQRRQVARAWADRTLLILGRAIGFIGNLRRLAAQVAGDLPVHDAQGQVLTGQAAFAKRQEIYAGDLCAEWRRAGDRNAMKAWLRSATNHDLDAGVLSSDISVAKAQLCERIDDAARDHLAYLLDCEDPAYARPVGTEQSTAVALLERRRQDGRRSVRAAATAAAAMTDSTNAIAIVEGVVVEHAPVWRSSLGGALSLSSKMFLPPWTSPGAGSYTFSLRVVRTGERAAANDAITLEAQDLPAGWTVALGAKQGQGAAAYWPVTVTATTWSAPHTYDFVLVARDAIGPARLRVRVRVPAASQ